jgi:hypothetical protein
MQEKLERVRQAYRETLDPDRPLVIDPHELGLLRESSNWIRRELKAEQSLFTAEIDTPGIIGSHGQYQWLTSVDHDISSLLQICPGVLLDKYLAVTSMDSAQLLLTDQEKSDGWWTADAGRVYSDKPDGTREDRGQVAYSPRLASVHGLPYETHECCAGFDEWYVFDQAPVAGEIEVFVNWLGFGLYDPGSLWNIEGFWEHMERLGSESYIAEGTVFTFATRNASLFASVLAGFSADPKQAG